MKRQHSHHLVRLLVLTAAASFSMVLSAFAAQTGIITGDVVNARTGPGTGYDRVEMLAKGKQVTILGEENGWYHIAWGNDKGYVYGDYISTGSSSSQASANATVTGGSTINVRSGPGTGYSRVAMVGSGKRVAMLDKSGDWYYISFDGKTGYILGDYVKPDAGALDAITAVEAAAPAETPAETPAEEQILTSQLTEESPTETAIPTTPAEATSVESDGTGDAPEGETNRSGFITGGTINVRSGPGTDYDRVAQLYTGKRVNILDEENGWFRISAGDISGYVLGDYVFEGDSLPASTVGEQVAVMAQQYLGVRYVYGGASPSGFDCSGFTMYLYRQFGYSLPHTASGQYANCGYKVSRDQLQPGDLVFFTSSGNGGRINHVGIYIGNGNVIHARMSVGQVYINNLSESYYSNNYVGAVRIA